MKHETMRALGIILGGAILAIGAAMYFAPRAHAADLGGDCCSDLESRIAELEATTARKGNRKVSLTVSGQIDAAYNWTSIDGFDKGQITQNGNDESYIGISGSAQVMQGWHVGYNLEIDLRQLGLLNAPVGGVDTSVRQSYWFIKSDQLGTFSMGRQAQATQDFDKWSTNNAWIAGKPLSLGTLSDLYLTGIDLPFDGRYRDALKYESPTIAGFSLSASWGASVDGNATDGTGNSYDVALRFANEAGGFKFAGAAGYRHDTDFTVNALGVTSITIPTGDVDTFLLMGSVKHFQTGLFVNVNYARQDWDDAHFNLDGIEATAGIERKFFALGQTSLFGTWGRYTLDPNAGQSGDLDYWGLGAVQSVDAAATDFYVGYRHYNSKDAIEADIDAVTAGAKVKF